MEINIEKCADAKQFIEMINDCIETLEELKEQIILQEVYYDEL